MSVICKFEQALRQVGWYSESTLAAYVSDVQMVNRKVNLLSADVAGLKNSLAGLQPATYNRRRTSLMLFYKWAVEVELCADNPAMSLPFRKLSKETVSFMSESDFQKLRQALVSYSQQSGQMGRPLTVRNVLMIDLMFYYGLAVSELAGLKLQDFNRHTNVLYLQRFRYQRTVKLAKEDGVRLANFIDNYRKQFNGAGSTDCIFVSNKISAKGLSRKSIWRIIATIGRQALGRDLNTNVLRSSYIIHALMQGDSVTQVQAATGIVDVNSLNPYITVAERIKARSLKKNVERES